MKVLVVSDNKFLIEQLCNTLHTQKLSKDFEFDFVCSPNNTALLSDTTLAVQLSSMDIKKCYAELIGKYALIFSLHCKQIFPTELVRQVKCINVHPGFNPYNRGWFPQVFSILNGMKAGATIHEIDEHLDHGNIIAQKEITIEKWDTSFTAYQKIQQLELELLSENLVHILNNTYQPVTPVAEGNVNLKKDFNRLCKLNLDEQQSLSKAIDLLRALTHEEYQNAYFFDPVSGKKVFVSISLKVEE